MTKKYLPDKNFVGTYVPIYQQPVSRFDFEGIAKIVEIIENNDNDVCVRARVHFTADKDSVYFERRINKKDLEGKGE